MYAQCKILQETDSLLSVPAQNPFDLLARLLSGSHTTSINFIANDFVKVYRVGLESGSQKIGTERGSTLEPKVSANPPTAHARF